MSCVPGLEHYNLRQVLEALKGVCGRSRLLEHLSQYPVYDGAPTHHRIGNKIVFFTEDLVVLKASLARPPEPKPPLTVVDYSYESKERKFQRVQKKLQPQKKAAKPRKPKASAE